MSAAYCCPTCFARLHVSKDVCGQYCLAAVSCCHVFLLLYFCTVAACCCCFAWLVSCLDNVSIVVTTAVYVNKRPVVFATYILELLATERLGKVL